MTILYRYANVKDWYVDDIFITGMQTIDGDKILLTSKDADSLKYTIDPKIQEELESQLKEHLEKKEDWLNDC